jgi:hypothetical protein
MMLTGIWSQKGIGGMGLAGHIFDIKCSTTVSHSPTIRCGLAVLQSKVKSSQAGDRAEPHLQYVHSTVNQTPF